MLSIVRAEISDTGMYTCNVSTSFTFVLSQVEVIVGGKCGGVKKCSDNRLLLDFPGLIYLFGLSAILDLLLILPHMKDTANIVLVHTTCIIMT